MESAEDYAYDMTYVQEALNELQTYWDPNRGQ